MKQLKAKLMGSIAMLLVSAVMLTSASFAWFTISTAPEVSNVSSKVTANANLEMALDNGYTSDTAVPTIGYGDSGVTTNEARNFYWGNLVDLDSYFDASTGTYKDVVLSPVIAWQNTTTGVLELAAPTFGLDGRVDGRSDYLVAQDASAAGVVPLAYKVGGDTIAYRMDLWLRTNEEGVKVNLGDAAMRGDSASEEGLGSWLSSNDSCVYVVVVDTDTNTFYTTSVADSAGTDGNYALTLKNADGTADATIDLTKNVGKKIYVYVYVDAAKATNASLTTAAKDIALNLQFVDSTGAVTAAGAMQVTETANYGRTT